MAISNAELRVPGISIEGGDGYFHAVSQLSEYSYGLEPIWAIK